MQRRNQRDIELQPQQHAATVYFRSEAELGHCLEAALSVVSCWQAVPSAIRGLGTSADIATTNQPPPFALLLMHVLSTLSLKAVNLLLKSEAGIRCVIPSLSLSVYLSLRETVVVDRAPAGHWCVLPAMLRACYQLQARLITVSKPMHWKIALKSLYVCVMRLSALLSLNVAVCVYRAAGQLIEVLSHPTHHARCVHLWF